MESELRAVPSSGASQVVDDVDAMPAVLADGIEGEYVQLEAAPFLVRWTVACGCDTVVQFAAEDQALIRRLRVPDNRWAFTIPLHVPAGARWNGRAVMPDDIVVNPPGTESFAFDPGGTQFAIVSTASSSALAAAARALVAEDRAGTTVATCSQTAIPLRAALERLRLVTESAAFPPAAAAEACTEISAALAGCLGPRRRRRGVWSPASRSHIVFRAEQCFRSHVAEGLSIARLSRLAGVSERSLRNAFHDVYTTSPKRYLKLWQLHQVHHALRSQEDGQRGTVTDVATCHGFYELGRFAGEYKSLFGEAPSATLHRARRDADGQSLPSARMHPRVRGGTPPSARRHSGSPRRSRGQRARLRG